MSAMCKMRDKSMRKSMKYKAHMKSVENYKHFDVTRRNREAGNGVR